MPLEPTERGQAKLVSRRPPEIVLLDQTVGERASYLLVPPDSPILPFTSKVKLVDLEAAVNSLRRCLPPACRRGGEFLAKEERERDVFLRDVALIGRALFGLLVPEEVRESFLVELARYPEVPIRAVQTAASLPWEAIFLPSPVVPQNQSASEQTAAPTLGETSVQVHDPSGCFLGTERLVLRDTKSWGRVRDDQRDIFGVVVDTDLGSVASGRSGCDILPALGGQVDRLPTILAPPMETLIKDFFDSKEGVRQAYHFDCHVKMSEPLSLDGSSIQIEKRYALQFNRIEDLVRLPGSPFLFLNLCYGGIFLFGGERSYASKFAELGAGDIVATETAIGDDFAAEFAETFYLAATSGITVGEALLVTRRAFVKHDRNPSALFYTLYSRGDSKLKLGPPNGCNHERALARLASVGWRSVG